MARLVADRRQQVGEAARQLVRPGDYVARKRQDLAVVIQSDERLYRLGQAIYRTRTQYLENTGKLLESYSYKGVLERGFVVVRDSAGAPVTAAPMLSPGDDISLAFKDDGRAEAVVSSVGTGDDTPRVPKKPKAKKKPAAKRGGPPPDDSQGSLL
jgi:exodeoxyribonuclease VII large subunit